MNGVDIYGWYDRKRIFNLWFVDKLPVGEVYVEPFGTGVNTILNKALHSTEVYNDINEDLINLFRSVQGERRFERLLSKLESITFNDDSFDAAIDVLNNSRDLDERALAFFILSNISFPEYFDYEGIKLGSTNYFLLVNFPNKSDLLLEKLSRLEKIRDRLMRVQIDCRDIFETISYWDREDTVFYIEPPYLINSYECSPFNRHDELISLLFKLEGNFALSFKDNSIYDALLEIPGVKKYTQVIRGNNKIFKDFEVVEALYVKGN